MSGLIAYQLRVRRLELTAVLVSAGLSALLWHQEIPSRFFRPDLSPEQMLQLFAVLQASCFLLSIREDRNDTHLRLASIRVQTYALGMTAAFLSVYALAGCAAAAAMPAESAATYLRNLAAYAGVGLLLGSRRVTVGVCVIWIWLAVAMSSGRSLVEGQVTFAWWAYPLHPADAAPHVAGVLLLAGVLTRAVRP